MQAPPGAFWIGSPHPFDLAEAYVDFRRTLTITELPSAATLFITADSRYRLWINGTFVGRGPSRCWPHAQQVDAINVARYLHKGGNVLAVQLYSPGCSHFAAVHRGAAGFIAWFNNNADTLCVTDADWRSKRDWSWRAGVARVSIYGSGVERCDMRQAEEWWRPDFNDETWSPSRIVAPAESSLWPRLMPRDVPMLAEEVTTLAAPWQMRAGPLPSADDPHEALREIWRTSTPAAVAEAPVCVWVFDLGVARVCQGIAYVQGALGGERLLIGYAEKLRDDEVLLSDPATYCRMRPTDEFILRPGAQTIEGFSLRGGRYLIFALCSPEGRRPGVSFAVRHSLYMLQVEELQFRDPLLQSIAQLCRRTLHACLQDGFVDSVWRESSQWLGDGVAQAFALAAISSDHRPLRRLITMAADGAYADGILPSVLPGEVHAYTVTDYNFSWIELLAMYQAPDWDSLLAEMRPIARQLLARFAQDLGPDGLIRSQPGRRLFLDWSGVDRREPNLTYNARYLYALQLAEGLGIGSYVETIARLRRAITDAFSTDGRWRENGFGTPASQLGLALLLLTGCATNDVADAIVARSLDLDDEITDAKLVLASPFMHHYVFLALDRIGRTDDILAIVRARWGRWAAAGEATCWENWNVDFPDGSTCHGFSAHPLGWLKRLSPSLQGV